jgi:hypothetical protein
VAATADKHAAELVTCNQCASKTYERYGTQFRLL